MGESTVDDLVGRSRALRFRAVALGLVAALCSAVVPFTPSPFQWIPLTGLGVAALGTLWAGWSMAQVSSAVAVARRVGWWPWMYGGVAPASGVAAAQAAWRVVGHPSDAVWGAAVGGKGRKASWVWAPVRWSVPGAQPDAQGEVPWVRAWALHLVFDKGPPPGLGRVRRAGARPSGRGWSPVAFAHPAMASWQIHAQDSVQTTRVWTPVAVERWLDVPLDDRVALDGLAAGALCTVPAEWIEGPDPAPMAALSGALRAAIGAARWDATVGPAWCPLPFQAGGGDGLADSLPPGGPQGIHANARGVR
jgi:hypothetical protein